MARQIKSNPLLDTVFLQQLYSNRHKEIYAKIIALDNNENAIEQIEGQVTGGSVSLDGSSNVRRSCNLTLIANEININSFYWGIKNKFKLFIGLRNNIDSKYDDIIWFPFGTMVITNFSTSLSASNYSISISGKDKICLLNGELSGSLFACVDFGQEEIYDTTTKVTTIRKIPIKDIVREAVHEYAQEPWDNIIVNDLDDYGLELLDYTGAKPLYLIIDEARGTNEDLGEVINITLDGETKLKNSNNQLISLKNINNYNPRNNLNLEGATATEYDLFYMEDDDATAPHISVAKIEQGQTTGYRYTDITYAGDLILNVGESITAMLDKLVAMLGNWEYFYDIDGRFIFQRKRTYLDKTWNNIVTNNDESYIPTIGETYAESALWSSAVSWNFTDSFLVTSFNNTPVLSNIRNDYSIWGTKKSITGTELPVHLRYAIDKKPTYYKTIDGVIWTTEYLEGIYVNGKKTDKTFEEITSSIEEIVQKDQQDKIDNYKKTPNAVNLSEDWWEILDWANYYALLSNNQLPTGQMKNYVEDPNGAFFTNLNSYIPEPIMGQMYINGNSGQSLIYDGTHSSFGKWPEDGRSVYVIDVNSDGTLGYYGHGTNCTHTYASFLNNAQRYGITSYIYRPIIPSKEYAEITEQQVQEYMEQNITVIVNSQTEESIINDYKNAGANVIVINHCDWREIIFQMARDMRKYAHYTPYDENDGKEHAHSNEELLYFAENFATVIRENNGKNANDEWYYPTGKTGYEQYYTDLEGFWRQLYCPPQILATGDYLKTGVWTDRPQSGSPDYYTVSEADKTNILYFLSTNYVTAGDVTRDGWNIQVLNSPATLNFWFDFLDPDIDSDFSKYSIPAIGDRAKSVNDSMVKAIYFREVPNTIFTTNLETTEHKSGYTYMQYQDSMNGLFTISTQGKSAIDVMEEWLNNYVYAVESTNITTIPVYHLQPNTRIKVMDKESQINGDYVVSRISIPLTYNGTMSITATKVADRIY